MVALLEVDSGLKLRFYGDKALFRKIDTQPVPEPSEHTTTNSNPSGAAPRTNGTSHTMSGQAVKTGVEGGDDPLDAKSELDMSIEGEATDSPPSVPCDLNMKVADICEEKLPQSCVSRRKSLEPVLDAATSSPPLPFGRDDQNVMMVSNHCSFMDWYVFPLWRDVSLPFSWDMLAFRARS